MADTIQEDIHDLLSEGLCGAIQRENKTFSNLVEPFENRLVLFGAGAIGHRTARGLQSLGIQPLAFADHDPSLWGKEIASTVIMSAEDAVAKFRTTAAFVVTLPSRKRNSSLRDCLKFLRDVGCARACSFGPLYWKYASRFLPYYAIDSPHCVHQQATQVLDTAALWEDDVSRSEYLAQLRWRLLFELDDASHPASDPTWLQPDLFLLTSSDVFVDCGAYDGADILAVLRKLGPARLNRIVAFEPDPGSYAQLAARVAGMPGRDAVILCQAAVGEQIGRVSFCATGTPDSAMGAGNVEVDCVTLDFALNGICPSYIQMHIEGAELATLKGARHVIQQHAPILAIHCGHRQGHIWNVARLIRSMRSDYRFFLRRSQTDAWDSICYAVPSHRLRRTEAQEHRAPFRFI